MMDDARYHGWLLDMFRDADEATERSREKAARDLDYYDGKQWTAEEVRTLKLRGQPAITLNLIRNKIDYLQGLERQQRTKPNALPRTPSDEDEAHAATDALRFVTERNLYDDKRSDVWGDLLKVGWGGHEITVEPAHKPTPGKPEFDVLIAQCDWDRQIWDPYSSKLDFSDASYLGMIVWMDRDEAIRKYGPDAEQVFDETVTAEESVTLADKPQHEGWVSNGTRRRIRVVQLYHLSPEDGEWDYCEFTRGGILQSGPSPWLDEDGRREHPYAWRAAYVDRDNNRYGAVRDMVDPQDEMNKRRSKALHHFTSRQTFGNTGILGPNSVKDMKRQLAKPDGHIETAVNVEWGKNFGIIQTNDLASGHMELLQQAASVFETMGPNAAMQGKQSGAPSGRALLASQQGGTIQLGTLTDALRHMDHETYRKVWRRVRQFWTGEVWLRVTKDQNNLQWVGLNTPDMQPVADPMTGQPVVGPDGKPAMQPKIDPATGQPVLKNNVAGLDVDITMDDAPAGGTIADENFQQLIQLKQLDQNNEIPFSGIVAAAPNLRDKQQLVDAIKQREQAPPNPVQVAGAQAKVQDIQAAANLKNAKAAQAAAEIPHTAAKTALDQANTRKAVVQTHGAATGSLKQALDIATLLQNPLVPAPPGFTVAAPPGQQISGQ